MLVTVLGNTIKLGSFVTTYERSPRHARKMSFIDHNRREYSFREEDRDRLIVYPSKHIVAEGNVTYSSGAGKLKIVDKDNAPMTAMLVGAYVDLVRRQAELLAWRKGTTIDEMRLHSLMSPSSQLHRSS